MSRKAGLSRAWASLVLLIAGISLCPAPAGASDRNEEEALPAARPLAQVDPKRAERMAELGAAAERIRGLKLSTQPPWLTKSPSEVYLYMLRSVQSDANPRAISLAVRIYAAFGFWAQDFDLLGAELESVSGAARAYYNQRDDDFTLVREPSKLTKKSRRGEDIQDDSEVVHEYTHALQMHNGFIPGLKMGGTNDASQAARALVEGDAVMAMSVYLAEDRRVSPPRLDNELLGRCLNLIRIGIAANMQSPLFKKKPAIVGSQMIFSYTAGSLFAEAVYKQGRWDALNACYRVPPISTEQIIHPDKYLRPIPEDPVQIQWPDLRAELLPGAQIVDVDTLGELSTTVLLAGFVPKAEAKCAAEGWGGDLYAAFERTAGPRKGDVALAWLTVWDTEADAREFFESYSKALDKKCGVERAKPAGEGQTLEWRGAAAGQDASLEFRGNAVLAIERTDAAETTRLSKYFWSLKRQAPPERHREP